MTLSNQQAAAENLHHSHDINIDQLKINSIQSGASLNIGEQINSITNSEMQMEMGANSMNSGDCNQMLHKDDNLG